MPGITPGGGRPHKRTTASQMVQDSLRHRIVTLALVPGTALSRAEIAEAYGVSQTPVRDAMMKLEEEGLLFVYPQSKTVVSKIDISHARETQYLRLSLELEVTRQLTRDPDGANLRVPQRILDAQKEVLDRDDTLVRFAALDNLFHQSLCDLVGVSNLWVLITARSGHIDRLRKLNLPDPGKPLNILSYHEGILTAIRSGDLALVDRMVREHLSGTLSSVDQIRDRYPDYF
ncbi:MAG: GntR family transcriptional regulator [Rhodospirillum sp.]|nr:GntR family transcriptional regulator [Rhodospirillum sp.]MCF8490107.1 GntR family transcriptional regulator [Rhodospirillum sp.]MCF8501125.1 GntR family transcriptional regulator [Rhodospirillum sp.]